MPDCARCCLILQIRAGREGGNLVKKREFARRGIRLKTHKKVQKDLLTREGNIKFSLFILRPADIESARLFEEQEYKNAIIPLDIFLKIDKLPFKVTADMMLDIAYWAVKLNSYQECGEFYKRIKSIKINDDTIRSIVNYIGEIVFKEYCKIANEIKVNLNKEAIRDKNKIDGILYLMIDGSALNTRKKDENGSSWRENKLAVAFLVTIFII